MLSVTAAGGGHHGGDRKNKEDVGNSAAFDSEGGGCFSFVSEIDGLLVLKNKN